MNQTATQAADYGFKVREASGKHIFTYTPEQYTGRDLRPMIVTIAAGALLPLFIIQPSSVVFGVILWLALAVAAFYVTRNLMNRNRVERQFTVDAESVLVDGQRYARKDITDLYWKRGGKGTFENHPSNVVMAHNMGTIRGSVTAVASQGIENNRRKFGETLANKNCQIMFRYGNRNVILAKGLNPDTAEIMLERIAQL